MTQTGDGGLSQTTAFVVRQIHIDAAGFGEDDDAMRLGNLFAARDGDAGDRVTHGFKPF